MQRQLIELLLLLLPLDLKLLHLKLLLPRPLPGRDADRGRAGSAWPRQLAHTLGRNADRGRVGPWWPRQLAYTLPPRRPVESLALRRRLHGCYLGPHLHLWRERVGVPLAGAGTGAGPPREGLEDL